MNKTNINTSWLGRGAWGIVVLLVGLLLGSCEPAGPTGGTPEAPVLKTLPAECLEVNDFGTITAFNDEKEDCKLTEFAIPSEKDGIKITVIGNRVFDGFDISMKLTKLSIPNSVITIENHAFRQNELTSLSIGSSVETIGDYAFLDNGLKSITIPNSVKTIGEYAFQSNELKSLSIGNSVKTIEAQAFAGNELEKLSIPKSVTTIGNTAFAGNPNLETIILDPNEMLSFVKKSFSNGDLWAAYDGPNKGKAGTWTWDDDAQMWSFEAATTP